MENNNVIYVSDNESNNVEDIAPPSNAADVTSPTHIITPFLNVATCVVCHRMYPSMDALLKDHRGDQVNRIMRTILSCSLTRDTCVHVSSSSSPAPPRGSDAPAPRPLRAGGVHYFVPFMKAAEMNNSLPDYVDDRSGFTKDLLSRVNLNPSGSVPRPNFAQPGNIDLDLKL